MNRSSNRALQHESFNSPSMNTTTTHYYQMQSNSQYCSMRQKDHYSNTYSYKQDTTEQHHHPTGYKQSHQATATTEDQHQYTWEQHGTTKAKETKASARAKESTTKAKAMAATGTTTATKTTKEEKAKDTRTTRIWQRKRIQQQRKRQRIPGQQRYGKGKGHSNKGKGKGYYNNQPGGIGAKGKQATNDCYRCGQPGHMAKQCGAAIHNCDTGNFDTNDQTEDWYSQAHYDSNWYHQDQTQMHQQYPSQNYKK